MFLSRAPTADVVKLADRKGFVRVAVETGTPLVPIYVSCAIEWGERVLKGWREGGERGRRGKGGGRTPLVPIYVSFEPEWGMAGEEGKGVRGGGGKEGVGTPMVLSPARRPVRPPTPAPQTPAPPPAALWRVGPVPLGGAPLLAGAARARGGLVGGRRACAA
jgi:hypothetical protein